MKKLSVLIAVFMTVFVFAACGETIVYNDIPGDTIYNDIENEISVPVYSEPGEDRIVVNDYTVNVGEWVDLSAWASAGIVEALDGVAPSVSFAVVSGGDAVRVKDGKAYGVRSNSAVTVRASVTAGGKTYTDDFEVACEGAGYIQKEDDASWFAPIAETVTSPSLGSSVKISDPIDSLTGNRTNPESEEFFAVGTDISMVQQVLDMGGKYYDADGNEASVYQIMKDYGINTVRIRLWVDPFYYGVEDGKGGYVETYDFDNADIVYAYGGGICDTETVTKMAVDATNAGLEVMVCAHYTDYWSTSNHVMPKRWLAKILTGEITTADQMKKLVYDYTYDTLKYMIDAGAKIKYWQLGNENAGTGIITKLPTRQDKDAAGSGDRYNAKKVSHGTVNKANYGLGEGTVSTSFANLGTAYIVDAIQAVKDVYSDLGEERYTQTIYHAARPGSASGTSMDYDIFGISAYIQWGHGTPATLRANGFSGAATSSKPFMVVETSYAYTVQAAKYASNTFQAGQANASYPVSVTGQAQNLYDTIEAVASKESGRGVITWEGAWLPVKGAGWSDPVTSSASWSNQSFFSYDGKVLPSMEIFKSIWPTV